jgi:hypothetical protein
METNTRARKRYTVKGSSLGTCTVRAIVFLLSIVALETPEDSARSLTFANSPSNVDLILLEGYLEPQIVKLYSHEREIKNYRSALELVILNRIRKRLLELNAALIYVESNYAPADFRGLH